jgi:uncharacterized protein (TIGR03086 family)
MTGMIPADGAGLLGQAIGYALASARLITPGQLAGPTPCARWDLRMLLSHAAESAVALAEGLGGGAVALRPAPPPAPGGELDALRAGCARLLAAAAVPGGPRIAVADRELPAGILACAGAIELAVHGWDIAAACGAPRPIPPALARALLPAAPLLVGGGTRDGLFAAPVTVPGTVAPGDRLVAFLGRPPDWPRHPGTGPA